jgi:hypothetical protein
MISNEIGKWITSELNVINENKNNIFPLIAKNGAAFPYVIYQRDSVSTNYTKDGLTSELINIELAVVTDNYTKGVDIAVKIRKILDNVTLDDIQTELTNTNEAADVDSQSYIQVLTYNIKIKNQ